MELLNSDKSEMELLKSRIEELERENRELQHRYEQKEEQCNCLEEKYHQNRLMLDNMIEMNPYSICVFNINGKWERMNKAHDDLFGRSIIPPDDYNFWRDPNLINSGYIDIINNELLPGKKAAHFHPIWYNSHNIGENYADKSICIAAVCFPMKNSEGEIERLVVMHEDITERVLAQEALQKAHDDLKELNTQLERKVAERTNELENANEELKKKNGELEDFAFRVSHKLKNSILVLKRIVEFRMENLEDIRKNVGLFVEESDNLMEFVENLLQLARAGKVIDTKSEVDLNSLVRGLFSIHKTADIIAELDIKSPLPVVFADIRSLEQVFVNFFRNSFEHKTPDTDSIKIEIDGKQENGKVIISYKDNGEGISRENLEKVFEVSYSSKGRQKYGFGMTIAKKIVQAHDGSISILSEGENRGVEIVITLPCKDCPQDEDNK